MELSRTPRKLVASGLVASLLMTLPGLPCYHAAAQSVASGAGYSGAASTVRTGPAAVIGGAAVTPGAVGSIPALSLGLIPSLTAGTFLTPASAALEPSALPVQPAAAAPDPAAAPVSAMTPASDAPIRVEAAAARSAAATGPLTTTLEAEKVQADAGNIFDNARARPQAPAAVAPKFDGPGWREFRRGPLGLGKYPRGALPGDETISGYDREIWARTVRERIEIGSWDALDSSGKMIGTIRFKGASDGIAGSVLAASLVRLIKGLSRDGVEYSSIAKFRHRHTHPSGKSDRFSNGDIATDFELRRYFDRFPGLEHVDFEAVILYYRPHIFSKTNWFEFRKRAFILPPATRRGVAENAQEVRPGWARGVKLAAAGFIAKAGPSRGELPAPQPPTTPGGKATRALKTGLAGLVARFLSRELP